MSLHHNEERNHFIHRRKGGERKFSNRKGFAKRHYKRVEIGLEHKPKPMPINGKCNPLCPFFYCSQRSLFVTYRREKHVNKKVVLCRLTGSECIGAECKYASCRINSLFPDGRCAKALTPSRRPASDEELFREMEAIEDFDVESFR